jgi:hypothetical protein
MELKELNSILTKENHLVKFKDHILLSYRNNVKDTFVFTLLKVDLTTLDYPVSLGKLTKEDFKLYKLVEPKKPKRKAKK